MITIEKGDHLLEEDAGKFHSGGDNAICDV